jgi:hypothetical protein
MPGQVEKAAARAAAAAEAEAAADVCTLCGLHCGEAPDLDALWVWCGDCNRWCACPLAPDQAQSHNDV